MFDSFKVVGILASLALVSGCAAEVDQPQAEEGEGETVAAAQQSLDPDVVRLRAGKCNGDGLMIKNGTVYRLGVPVGPDVTGITDLTRSPDPICHNQTQWQLAANYVCSANGGGTRSEPYARYGEYIGTTLIWHEGGQRADGLYRAYVDVRGPCDSKSKKDYTLDAIECCMNPATPMP